MSEHNRIKIAYVNHEKDGRTLAVHIFTEFSSEHAYQRWLRTIPGVARVIEQASDRYRCIVMIGELHDPVQVAANIVTKLAREHLGILASSVDLIAPHTMAERIMSLVIQTEDAKMLAELEKEIVELEALRDNLPDHIAHNLATHVTPLRRERATLNHRLKRRRAELDKVTAGK